MRELLVRIAVVFGLALVLVSGPLGAADRDVQIVSVDIESSVVTLQNLGVATVDLDGWRFCSHDENETLRYTGASGLDGVSLAAGASLAVHLGNDAPMGDAGAIDASSLGGSFAGPLDTGPFSLSLYFDPVSFNDGATMADHLQWSILGADDGSADERSDEAQGGGLWIDQSEWISTGATSARVVLEDLTGATLHSPANYRVIPASVGPTNTVGEAIEGLENAITDRVGALADCVADRNCETFAAANRESKLLGAASRALAVALGFSADGPVSKALKKSSGAVKKITVAIRDSEPVNVAELEGSIEDLLGQADDAIAAIIVSVDLQAAELCEKFAGKVDKKTAKAALKRDLAEGLRGAGDPVKALKLYSQALKGYEVALVIAAKLSLKTCQ